VTLTTWQLWAPPLDPPVEGGLPLETATQIAAACPDPWLAAAIMWETWAAMAPLEPSVTQVATGVQSVSYSTPENRWSMAMLRAEWLRSMRGGLASVPLVLVDDAGPPCWWSISAWQDNACEPP
jgi:hypothetical protein